LRACVACMHTRTGFSNQNQVQWLTENGKLYTPRANLSGKDERVLFGEVEERVLAFDPSTFEQSTLALGVGKLSLLSPAEQLDRYKTFASREVCVCVYRACCVCVGVIIISMCVCVWWLYMCFSLIICLPFCVW
jgi:hypothetical protein